MLIKNVKNREKMVKRAFLGVFGGFRGKREVYPKRCLKRPKKA